MDPYKERKVAKFAEFREERVEKWLTCPDCWNQDLRINLASECVCLQCNTIVLVLDGKIDCGDIVHSLEKIINGVNNDEEI